MSAADTPSREDALLKRLDAGAAHQDYPEAFGESWTKLASDAAAAIRRLAAKHADDGVREVDPRVRNLAQKIRDSDIEQMGTARFAVLTVLIPEHEVQDFADALCSTKAQKP